MTKTNINAVWTCEPGWESALADELRRTLPVEVRIEPEVGFVRADDLTDDASPTVAFAQQCLPAAEPCQADSINDWAELAVRRIVAELDALPVPWRLHVFGPVRVEYGPIVSRRAVLIAARINEILRERLRRLARRRNENSAGPWLTDEALVQVMLTTPNDGYTSVCDAATRTRFRRTISRFIAGRVEPAVDKVAPSRAFAKLVEVELRLGRTIAAGERCVDLGSAPGSWAYKALARGATVTAVDRSPLRDDLMQNPDLKFVQGDAFRYLAESEVDWLLSDVIAFPARARELLEAWLGGRRCGRFCVTIKFRGRDDDAELEPIKQFLLASDYEFGLRRLDANKNEATAYGTRRDVLADEGSTATNVLA